MRIGISIPHTGPLSSPNAVRETAEAAEALGFDAIGVVDHVALPLSVASKYDLTPTPVAIPEGNMKKTLTPLYECLATAAFLAGVTRRVRIQTGVCVLPLRNPLYNARQIATIDAYSGGRFDLGVGVGWLAEEAEAMQMPWDHRGARTDEHIQVLRTLWEAKEPYVSFSGRFYRFENIDPEPFPAQGRLPIIVGGHTEAAKQRAARIGDGWMSAALPPTAQAEGMRDVRAYAEKAGRDPAALQWYASVRTRYENGGVKAPGQILEIVDGYRDLGVTSVMASCDARTLSDRMRLVEWLAKEVLPRR